MIKFEKRLNLVTVNILNKISQIDELKGQWKMGASLNPQLLGRLKKSVLITSTGASTRIEGARLSDKEIEKLIAGIAIQKFADRDKQEVKGYYKLLENIFNAWNNIRFSENTIKHLHQELLKYSYKDKFHKGQYKQSENRVEMVNSNGRRIGILFDTTPPYLTPKQTQELTEWTKLALEQKKYHPLLVIGNFLVEFLNIHPFTDGNGRLSRIITNLLLLQAGYPYIPYVSHEKLIEDQKPNYYIALRKSQKTFKKGAGNITAWLEFFLDIVLTQSKEAIKLILGEKLENTLSNKQLLVWEYLISVKESSPKQISQETDVLYATVRQTLSKLLHLKAIERIGMGRSTRYRKVDKFN